MKKLFFTLLLLFITTTIEADNYRVDKGWNRLLTPLNGVDIVKTFSHAEVSYVYLYDDISQAWAGYSPNTTLPKTIESTPTLTLKYVEAYHYIYVYADKKSTIEIKSTQINSQCQEKIERGYEQILASAFNYETNSSKNSSLSIRSRYKPHYRKGLYNDTRTLLLYKKLKSASKKVFHYGPANPPILLNYAREYEGQHFYIFDYFTKECYEGIFPSKRVPPFPTLKRLE
jgi:hypothetical protein